MHFPPLIHDLAVILGAAGLAALVFHWIKQPVVLGYLLVGLLIGPHTPPYSLVTDLPNIQVWAELGIIFLMFSLGLEFSFRKLSRVGVPATVTSLFEIGLMLGVGFLAGQLVGWNRMDSFFLGAMLSISSTTIIIKAFSELGLKRTKFAELVSAVLIVEDLVAVILLVVLSTFAGKADLSGALMLTSVGKLVLIVGCWFIIGYFVVPRFVKQAGRVGSSETLTILSVGLCLALVVIATKLEYSAALGAFIMGSILAESIESHRIEELMRPLRDVFAAVFFVSVGMLINPALLWEHRNAILVIATVTVVGKAFGSMVGALASGQSLRISTRVGLSLAQIGEFSFLIAAMGTSLKVTSDFLYPIGVAVSLVTTFLTPYLIRASAPVATFLEERLPDRALLLLNRYANRIQRNRGADELRPAAKRGVVRWLLNGLLVSALFVLAAKIPLDLAVFNIGGEAGRALIGWALAALLAMPFIWAMFTSFQGAFVIWGRLLTVVWVGSLSLEFFPARYVFLVTSLWIVGFFLLFYRHIDLSYQWFEKSFLSIFKEKDAMDGSNISSVSSTLAPWDAHLVRLAVHPNAAIVGKKLSELSLRNRFGLNVVAIHRNLESIVAPTPEEQIFPHDELWVLSTDDSVERNRALIENPSEERESFRTVAGFELKSLRVTPNSGVNGLSIRNAGVRERFASMVVGLERNGERLMNPDSEMLLAPGDILWIVGEAANIARLQREMTTGPRGSA